VDAGSDSTRLWLGRNSAGGLQVFGGDSGDGSVNFSLGTFTPDVDAVQRVAVAYKANDYAASLNGGTVATDTSATVPTVSNLRLAMLQAGSGVLHGHLRRIIYIPYRLPNALIQDLARGQYGVLTDELVGARDLYFGSLSTLGTSNTIDHAYHEATFAGFNGYGFSFEVEYEQSSLYDWMDLLRPTLQVSGSGAGITVYVNSAGAVTFNTSNVSSSYIASGGAVKANKRYMIHGTRASSLLSLFLNGTCVATATIPASFQFSNVSSHAFGFQSPATYFGVKLWDRGLSADEVLSRVKGQSVDYGLFMDLDFSASVANSGAVLQDRSGNGNHITLSNSFAWSSVGSEYPLFYGRTTMIRNQPINGYVSTIIEATSDHARLAHRFITTPLLRSINAASLFTEICSLSDVSSFTSDILNDTVEFAWYRDVTAAHALDELVQSGNYKLVVDGAGTLKLKNRYWGAFDTTVGSHDSFFDLTYRLTPDKIVNEAKIHATPRLVVTDTTTVYYLGSPVTIPGSSSVGFFVDFTDPVLGGARSPVASVHALVSSQDYFASVNSDGTGSVLTSVLSMNVAVFGSTAVVSIFNGGSDIAYLSRLQFRGYPIRELPPIGFKSESSSSQSVYGRKGVEVTNVLIQHHAYMRDLADSIVTEKQNPQDEVEMTLVNKWPAIFAYEAGQVLSVVNSLTGVNSPWTIVAMDHEINLADGVRHEARFVMDAFVERPYLVLDHATFGKLSDGRVLAL
jgi:hypothetical protein